MLPRLACCPWRVAREAAFVAAVATQVCISLSGSYGSFNVLSAVLALSFLDDSRVPLCPGVPAARRDGHCFGVALVAAPAFALYVARVAAYAPSCRLLDALAPSLRTASSTFSFATHVSLFTNVTARAAKGCEILNFEGSSLSQFPLVSAHFWTSDHLSSSSCTVYAFSDRIDR